MRTSPVKPATPRLIGAVSRAAEARAGVGVTGGLVAAAGFAAGLPVWPVYMLVAIAAAADWVAAGTGATERAQGLGVGALVGLAAAKGLVAGADWADPGCTGPKAAPWTVAVILGILPLMLALLDRHGAGPCRRLAMATALLAACAGAAAAAAPGCLPI